MRIATFNIENLDSDATHSSPALLERLAPLRATLKRLDADILCLQEVHGQELPDHTPSHPNRNLSALDLVVEGTSYEHFERAHTTTSGVPYDVRNLVVLSKYPLIAFHQYRNDFIPELMYRKTTEIPSAEEAEPLRWERPILHATVQHPDLGPVHIVNLHLKSRLSTSISGQKLNSYVWRSASGWAEGYFLSSVKRVGQALETRALVDSIFDQDADARIVVCGDFNAEPGEVPVDAIRGQVENTRNADLGHRVLIPCSLSVPESIRFTHLHHGQGNLLDHMMISKSLLPLFRQAMVFNENLHDESLPFQSDLLYPESDHAAFLSVFETDE